MKKIMFNTRFGLEQAVIAGTKTHTRRIIVPPKKFKGVEDVLLMYHARGLKNKQFYDCVVCDADEHELGQMPLPYEVGDTVAIAQSYKTLIEQGYLCQSDGLVSTEFCMGPGFRNKMFVRADLMPWQIVIDDLWFEKLQDISDADIMREGIMEGEFMNTWDRYYFDHWGDVPNHITFRTPRQAFASLINRVCGKYTWESNPWVAAYAFHLQHAPDRCILIVNEV